jgi:hypothetical protein
MKMERAQVNKLYDYTKFHIGLYAALMTALMTVLGIGQTTVPPEAVCYLKITLVCFTVAGMFGGILGSSISLYQDDLVNGKGVGMGRWKIPVEWCVHLEHWAFWIGIWVAVGGFLHLHQFPG